MRRLLRVLAAALGLLFAIWLAVWWRASPWAFMPAEDIANWLIGRNRPWSLIAGLFDLILIVLAFFAVRFWFRVGWFHLLNRKHNAKASAGSAVLSDSPLASAKNDGLSRSDFVQSVAALLQPDPSSDSTVVA